MSNSQNANSRPKRACAIDSRRKIKQGYEDEDDTGPLMQNTVPYYQYAFKRNVPYQISIPNENMYGIITFASEPFIEKVQPNILLLPLVFFYDWWVLTFFYLF